MAERWPGGATGINQYRYWLPGRGQSGSPTIATKRFAHGPKNHFCSLFQQFISAQEATWERAIYLDGRTRRVWVLGRPITRLTGQEFKLFGALYARPGELLLKDELIDIGWPTAQGHVSDETLTATMSRLRKKIEPEPDKPRFLETVRGHGYILKSEP